MTGATVRLGESICSDCYASNPEDAWSCANCGRRLAIETTPATQAAPVIDKGSASGATASDYIWLGDLLLVIGELLASL
jgi:hypothetical protein